MGKLTLDINGRCNQDCTFCYQNLDGSSLSTEQILERVQQTTGDMVEIGGGEPFLDSRIVELIKTITSRQKKVHISTNASVIPRGLFDLEEAVRANTQVQVSIHGSNPERYARIHGKDHYARVIENIHELGQRFRTNMTSAIYQENLDDVPNLVGLSRKLGIPIRINLVFPVGKGRDVQRLDVGQVDELTGYLLEQKLLGENIDSPLIHENNCYAVAEAYGLPRGGLCPLDCGKVYLDPRGVESGCEFCPRISLTKAEGGEKNV